jgi:NitT/TauT family transport system substrate-binding protein
MRVRGRAIAVLSLVTALVTAACGGSSGGAPSGSGGPEKTHLTVAALPIVDDAPLFVAIRNGYFRQQGLTVTPKIIAQSTLALPDLLHGAVDIVAGGNYVSYFEGQASGTFRLRLLVAGTECRPASFGVLALPGSGITSPAGLAGKSIAVNLASNIQTLTTSAALRADGVSPASVRYVVIPFPDMAAALQAHRVDAISVVEPFLTGAEQAAGARLVLSECSGALASFPLSGYFTTAAWAAQNPRTARAFQRAMQRAQAYADAHPAAIRQILPTYTKVTAQAAQKLQLNYFPAAVSASQLQRVANLMRSGGLLKAPFAVGPVIFR